MGRRPLFMGCSQGFGLRQHDRIGLNPLQHRLLRREDHLGRRNLIPFTTMCSRFQARNHRRMRNRHGAADQLFDVLGQGITGMTHQTL
jgi:hypothetical protein